MNEFGGSHTTKKLDTIQDYLEAYTTALSNQNFRTVYFDAFAGSGEIKVGDEVELFADVEELQPIVDGSAKRALQLKRPFDEYIFVENKNKKVQGLKALANEFPQLLNRIEVIQSDANAELNDFCRDTNWKETRAVVFLDPFGNQVEWDTILKIAKTKSIDLWYLFPAGLGVNRQISNEGVILPEHEESLNKLLGTNEWKEHWTSYSETPDLFGGTHRVSEKQITVDGITKYVIARMKSVFEGVVINSWLPLGPNGAHWYSLLFACSNPSPKARQLASKLASAVMNRK